MKNKSFFFQMKFFKRLKHRSKIFFCIFVFLFLTLMINYSSIYSNKNSLMNPLVKSSPAYVITLFGHDKRVPFVKKLFLKYANLDLHSFYGLNGNNLLSKSKKLTSGERGLKETMKLFFQTVANENFSSVFLFEDDAIPHKNFTNLFKQLPSKCLEADLLLLGATMWHSNLRDWPSEPCFDADTGTRGAFASFIKQSAFLPILELLNKDLDRPYDNMYPDLQKKGIIVRVAHPPFLAIPDISHPSLIDNHRGAIQFNIQQRALKHGWNLDYYPVSSIPVEKS
jgi:hypothetical protein